MICAGQGVTKFPIGCVQRLVPSITGAPALGASLQEAQLDLGVPAIPILVPIVDALVGTEGQQVVQRVKTLTMLLSKIDLAVCATGMEIEKFFT